MFEPFSKISSQKWAPVGLLAGFCLLLYFVNLGQWDLWNPDEPRYAQVTREMVTGGDWILMHFNGIVYPDKPPSVLLGSSPFHPLPGKDLALSPSGFPRSGLWDSPCS